MGQGYYLVQRKLGVLAAAAWDGKTKYKLQETEEEKEKRLEKWDEYLNAGDKEEVVEGSGGDST